MYKKYCLLFAVVLTLLVLLLPACTAEEPAPTPAPAPTPSPTTAPAPAPTAAPAPTTTPAPAPAPEKTGTLKLSYTVPKGKTYGVGMDDFAVQFEKATGGRYKVEVYPSNSLVSLTEAWDATVGGKAEIVVTSTSVFARQFLLNNIISIISLGWNVQSPEDIEDGWAAWWELIDAFPEVAKEFEGVKLLNPMIMDQLYFLSKDKPVRVPSDLKGLKVGMPGLPAAEMLKAYGGVNVMQVPPQAYMNMDKGVVDACAWTFGMVADYSMEEVAQYMLVQPMSQSQLIIIMNQEAWDGLSAKDQGILEDTMRESLKLSAQASSDSQEVGKKRWLDAGRTIIYPTPDESALWEDAAVIAIRKWRDDAVAAGISPEVCSNVFTTWKEIRKEHGQK